MTTTPSRPRIVGEQKGLQRESGATATPTGSSTSSPPDQTRDVIVEAEPEPTPSPSPLRKPSSWQKNDNMSLWSSCLDQDGGPENAHPCSTAPTSWGAWETSAKEVPDSLWSKGGCCSRQSGSAFQGPLSGARHWRRRQATAEDRGQAAGYRGAGQGRGGGREQLCLS